VTRHAVSSALKPDQIKQKRILLRLQVQAPMLVAAEKLALRSDALAFRQMHAAMGAAHHIFACGGRCLILLLFPAQVFSYCPENQHGKEGKKYQSTQDNYLRCRIKIGRGERIRTSDSCVPNAVLYQAELHPEND